MESLLGPPRPPPAAVDPQSWDYAEAARNPSPWRGAGTDGCSWAEVPRGCSDGWGAGWWRKWPLWITAGQALMDVTREQGWQADYRV